MGDIYFCGPEGICLVNKPRGSAGTWKDQIRRGSTKCKWCGSRLNRFHARKPRHVATVDHILPRCLGGPDTRLNTKASCEWCNCARAAAGHCIGMVVCISSIVGNDLSKIARYYNRIGL